MTFSMVHSPSGIRVIGGVDTKGFSYIEVGKGLKSHSIILSSEANVLAVKCELAVRGKRGTHGDGHRTPLGSPKKVLDFGPLGGERAKGLLGEAGPAREDGARGPVGNQAESQVLRGEGRGEGGSCLQV